MNALHTGLKLLKTQNGMSLTELLVASGLSAVALVLMASVMVETTNLSKGFEARARDEVEVTTAERQLRNIFQQAVDLTYTGAGTLNFFNGTPTYTGALRDYNSDDDFLLVPVTRTLAVFWRDVAQSKTPPTSALNLETGFVRTGVFFQTPTPTTWGILYIDTSGGMSPDRSDLMFEGLSGIRIYNVRTYSLNNTANSPAGPGGNAPVASFDIEMTLRKFINPKGQADYIFCPRAYLDLPSWPLCARRTPIRDVTRTVRIVVRNNTLMISPTSSVPMPPPIPAPPEGVRFGARVYDRIHFFKPFTRSGLL